MRSTPAHVALLLVGLAAFPARGAELQRLELEPSWREADGKVMDVALEDLDGDGVIDPVVASSRSEDSAATERWLGFYRRAGADGAAAYELTRQTQVPDDVIAYGFGDLVGAGARRLLYFTSASVFSFDTESGEATRVLGGERLFFAMPSPQRLPRWDAITDLDGDGRDDLILADRDGYLIYRQNAANELESVGRVQAGSSYSNAPTTERAQRWQKRERLRSGRAINRLCLADLDADSRIDLIAMKKKELLGFTQRDDGRFDSEPDIAHRLIAPGGVPFESFGSDTVPRIGFGDANRDGRVDFVVPELDLEDLATRLRIFLTDATGLPARPSQILKLSSLGGAPQLIDINGDGFLDLGVAAIRTDLLLTLANPTEPRVDFTYYGFLFSPELGSFSRRPDIKWDTSYTLPESDEEQEQEDQEEFGDESEVEERDPAFIRIDGDFDGDGYLDLAALDPEGLLQVYRSRVSGADSMTVKLSTQPLIEAQVPPFPIAETVDLNGDGKSDFALQYDDAVLLLVTR